MIVKMECKLTAHRDDSNIEKIWVILESREDFYNIETKNEHNKCTLYGSFLTRLSRVEGFEELKDFDLDLDNSIEATKYVDNKFKQLGILEEE